MEFLKRTWAEINLDALKHNIEAIRSAVPPQTGIIAVVKADAYGHGDGYIAGELEQLDTDMAVSLLDKYTRDKKYALSLKYSLAKNIPSDAKRQQILMSIYDTIRQDSGARFEGSNNVYMDIGLIFYRKNDFKNAVLPLKQFTDNYKEKDDRRAEALYYLGKSFINMGDVQRGYNYYNDIFQQVYMQV